MKNGLLIWNAVLTLVAGYLLFTHFTSKKECSFGNQKVLQKIRLPEFAFSHCLFRNGFCRK